MFFSASISLKLRELANTKTSTMAIRRDRNVTAVSEDMPCVASMFSNSVLEREENRTNAQLPVIHEKRINIEYSKVSLTAFAVKHCKKCVPAAAFINV